MSSRKVQIELGIKDRLSREMYKITSDVRKQLKGITQSARSVAASASQIVIPATIATGAFALAGNNMVEIANNARVGVRLFNKQLLRLGKDTGEIGNEVRQLAEKLKIPEETIHQNATQLLRVGYDFNKISKIYTAGAASSMAAGKSSAYGVEKITEALINENSVMLNRIGISQNLDTARTKYAKQLGKSTDALTEEEKVMAHYNMILKVTKEEVEDISTIFEGLGGAKSENAKELYKLRVEWGERLIPIWIRGYKISTDLYRNFNNLSDVQKDNIVKTTMLAAGAVAGAAALGLVARASTVVVAGVKLVAGVVSLATSPIVLGTVAIAAGATLAYQAWNRDWLGIKSNITPLIDKVKEWASIENLKKIASITINKADEIYKYITGDTQGIIKATIRFTGEMIEELKQGNLNKVLDIASTGVLLKIGLDMATGATAKIIGAIGSAFGASGLAKMPKLGLAFATISVGVALKEAMDTGGYAKFAADIIAALLAGFTAGGLTGSASAGVLVFTATLNFEIGSKIFDKIKEAIILPDNAQVNEIEYFKNQWGILAPFMYNWFGKKKATGGLITGPGTGTSDSIPAVSNSGQPYLISNGEYIINAAATKRYKPLLDAINFGQVKGYKTGGIVGNFFDNLGFGDTDNFLSGVQETIDSTLEKVNQTMEKFVTAITELTVKVLALVTDIPEADLRKIVEDIKGMFDFSKNESKEEKEKKQVKSKDSYSLYEKIIIAKINTKQLISDFSFSIKESIRKTPLLDKTFKAASNFIGKPAKAYAGAATNVAGNVAQTAISGAGGGGLIQMMTGNFIGGLMSMLSQSGRFQETMEKIAPIIGTIANIVGEVLNPVLDLLAPALDLVAKIFRFVGIIVLGITKGILKAWNLVAKGIEAIVNGIIWVINKAFGWAGVDLKKVSLQVDTSGIDESINNLKNGTEHTAENTKKIEENTAQIAAALANAPSGFSVARLRHTVLGGAPHLDVGGTIYGDGYAKVHKGEIIMNKKHQASLNSGGDTFHIHVNADLTDKTVDKLVKAIEKAKRGKNQRRTGSIVGGAYA